MQNLIQKVASRYIRAAWGRLLPTSRATFLTKEVRDSITPINPEGTDLEVWKYDLKGTFYALVFHGKANKPLYHFHFRTEAARDQYVDETIEARKKAVAYKKKMRQERADYQHNYKVGDILYASWGYDQTNVDWFEVVEVVGKMIVLRPIEGKTVRSEQGSELVVAVPGKFTGPPIRKIPGSGGGVKIKSFMFAYLWDGKPKHETAWGWGH